MEKIPVAEHLTDSEYNILIETHLKHNATMGEKEQGNYTLLDIVKVERNVEENCLNVYYKNGEWWHYTPNKTWY